MSGLDPTIWRDLVGMPFRRGGRGPDEYDCFGLLVELYRRRGIEVAPRDTPRGEADQASLISATLGAEWRRIECPQPGCGLLFRDTGLAPHVGVHLGGDRFIHATARLGQVAVERLSAVQSFLPLLGAYEPV